MKAIVFSYLVLFASTAFAQPKKVEAENAYKYGQSLYVKEDYAGAATQFKAAYDADPDPVYLFNVAQALRLAKQCKESSDYYKRYLKEAKNAPNEDAVKAYIIEVDDCAKAQAVVTPVDPPKPDPQPVSPITDEPPKSKRRLIGYGVGGAGVVGVALGFYFMARVSSLEDDANNVCPDPCSEWTDTKEKRRDAIDSRAHLREKLMVGSWIAGGAALAAGIYLIVTGGEQTESSVAITPTRNGAMLSLAF